VHARRICATCAIVSCAGSRRADGGIAPGSIVVAADLPPSRFLEIAWDGGGVALTQGSANSHVAMLARSRGVPMLVGVEKADLSGHTEALIDTDNAVLVASPTRGTRRALRRASTAPSSRARRPNATSMRPRSPRTASTCAC
jgi:phosphotransferase system enzyme I (PtsI)